MGSPALPTRVEKRDIHPRTSMLGQSHTATGNLRSGAKGKAPPSTLGEQGRVSHHTTVQIKAEPAWSPGRLRLPRLLRRHFLAPLKPALGFANRAAECLHCFPCTGPGRAWSFLKETVAAGIWCNTIIRGLYPFKNTSFLLVASPPTAL